MLPKRWLPLPTSREILRRTIATFTLAAYLLPMAGISVAQAQTAPADSNRRAALCEEINLLGSDRGNKAENFPKFRNWNQELENLTREHNKHSPDHIKDSMIEELKKINGADLGALEDAGVHHRNYLKEMANAADKICPIIQQFDADIARFQQKVQAAKAQATSETCAFADLRQISQDSANRTATITEAISSMTEQMRSLYGEYARQNKAAVEQTAKVAMKVRAEDHAGAFQRGRNLTQEYVKLWGSDPEVKSATEGKLVSDRPTSLFGRMLAQLEQQTERMVASNSSLRGYAAEMTRLETGACGSIIRNQPGQGVTGATPPAAGAAAGAGGAGASRICAPGQVANFSNGGATVDPSVCTTPAPGISGTATPSVPGASTPGTATPGSNNGNADPLTVDDPEKTGAVKKTPVSPTPTPVEEESFLSKYKTPLIIGGVGVAAVAGALIYKKTEDDKAKKNARYMEMEAAMTVQSQQQNSSSSGDSSGSSSSDGGGESQINTDSTLGSSIAPNQTPVGSTLLVVNSPSGNYSTNSALPDITVKVLNPNGIATDDSTTDITVSCATATPSPCTLTGTLTVNTNLGKAVFSGLKFTGAHNNVTLQFSAAGFQSVQSGNFNVSARQ